MSFTENELLLAIPNITRKKDNVVGVMGIVVKQDPDMGKLASRFALDQKQLLTEGKFASINSTGDTITQLLIMAFGGNEPRYICDSTNTWFNIDAIANLDDNQIIALVQGDNS